MNSIINFTSAQDSRLVTINGGMTRSPFHRFHFTRPVRRLSMICWFCRTGHWYNITLYHCRIASGCVWHPLTTETLNDGDVCEDSRTMLLTSWRASLATWLPTSGEEGKNKSGQQMISVSDTRFTSTEVIEWSYWESLKQLKRIKASINHNGEVESLHFCHLNTDISLVSYDSFILWSFLKTLVQNLHTNTEIK